MSCKLNNWENYFEFQLLPSGSQLRFPYVRSNRYKHSFIPTSISLINSGMWGVGRCR